MKNIISITFFLLTSITAFGQNFKGTILDKKTKEVIPFANVHFLDLKTGVSANENGVFQIDNLLQKKLSIEITMVGYKPLYFDIYTDSVSSKIFYLEEGHFELKEFMVSVPNGKLQEDNVVHVTHRKIKDLQLNSPLTLTEGISNIPGVEQNATGVGIGKPVIRGLSGNRIVTYAQGVRVENQQWGGEHGLGIGDVGIESVEVIKGPASLLYGSDAIGGVLYFIDEKYANQKTIEGFFQTKFISNTLGTMNQIGVKINNGKLKFNLFGSYSSHADYMLSNKWRVNNTRFDAKNIKSSVGYSSKNWLVNLRYSFLQNDFGITEDSIFHKSSVRSFKLPFQIINNHTVSLDNTFYLKDSKLNLIIGYANNNRKEFENDKLNPALGMKLTTGTYNLKWNLPTIKKNLHIVIGSQGMLQDNTNNGIEILIPDASTRDIGAFTMVNLSIKKIKFLTGIRIDNRKIKTLLTDNILALERNFTGITYSLGLGYKVKSIHVRLNGSSGFRAPNTSELLSNGVHEGTNRYEIGNSVLQNENATQIDVSLDLEKEHFKFSVNPFYNYIKNYIYLTPSNLILNNNYVYNYVQKNAFLYGGEAGVHYHPHQLHILHLESSFSSVYAQDVNNNPLPTIPQNKFNSTIKLTFKKNNKINITSFYVQHIYKFKQARIGLFETETSGYNLVNVGLEAEIKTHNNVISLNTGVKNIFNTSYIDHLSNFKKLGIKNPGVNFYIGVKYKFERKINH